MTIACPLCPDVHPDPGTLPCPGNCNRAWAAAERDAHTTGQPNPLHMTPGQPLWCHDCRERIAAALLDIPNLAASLGSGKLLTPATEIGRLSRPDVHLSPSPAFDLADEATRWGMATEGDLRHWLGHPPADQDHRGLHRSLAYITTNLSPMLSRDPAGIAFGTEALRWVRRLQAGTGTADTRIRIPGACPHCKARGLLSRDDGSTWTTCAACSTSWDAADDQEVQAA